MTLAEQILAAVPKLVPVCVHDPAAGLVVPGLEAVDAKLFVRELTAAEWNESQSEQLDRLEHGGKSVARANWHARFVSLCLVDEQGLRVFTEADQVTALGEKGRRIVGLLYDHAANINGLGADSEKLEKN